MITIDHVTKRFGRVPAVDDVSLEIQAGRSVALWGTNGAGKTTLLRCVLGLLPFRGRITVGGHDVRGRRGGKSARCLIGYVPQELGFYDDLGVSEAVVFFARLKGLDRRSTVGALERVGLAGHERKRIRELSGGMKQRLALALALLGDPPVLVLDEVTASLDALGRGEFIQLLERLSGAGRTLLFASHRIDEIGALAGHVACLEKGRMTRIVSRECFLGETGRSTVLHLTLPTSMRSLAIESLRAGGFNPALNGVGILVPVPHDQKAAPFRVLADARVRIDDFELLPGTPDAATNQPPPPPAPPPRPRSTRSEADTSPPGDAR